MCTIVNSPRDLGDPSIFPMKRVVSQTPTTITVLSLIIYSMIEINSLTSSVIWVTSLTPSPLGDMANICDWGDFNNFSCNQDGIAIFSCDRDNISRGSNRQYIFSIVQSNSAVDFPSKNEIILIKRITLMNSNKKQFSRYMTTF